MDIWTCERCGGRRRLIGRHSGKVHMTCSTCSTSIEFSSMDAAVQAERLANENQRELALALVVT